MQGGPTSPEQEAAPASVPEEEAAAAEEEEMAADEDEEAEGERRRAAAAARSVVMVKRELLTRCMTCPLCKRLLRDATTISECLHTFCRKCIYVKLNDEELDYCPVCKIDLGCAPVEKLRADHNLQDVRSKIFPLKRKKIEAEEVSSPITLPLRRKERSISSLVVNTSRVTQTGRRTRAVARKAAALRGLGPIIEDPVKRESDNAEKRADNAIFTDNFGKMPQTRRQISSNAEASNRLSNKDDESDNKASADKAELWRPLNCLVEAANRTKSFRSSPQNSAVKVEQLNDSPSGAHANKTKAREPLHKSKIQDEKKDVVPLPPMTVKRKGPGRKRRELRASPNAVVDAAAGQHSGKFGPIWFLLVASLSQKGDPPLPPLPIRYLRIKDGNVPASSIQKYVVQKLGLPSESESEVEISCRGQPVNLTQPLHNLVEQWLRTGPIHRVQTVVGSSARDFLMVLTYGRAKALAS